VESRRSRETQHRDTCVHNQFGFQRRTCWNVSEASVVGRGGHYKGHGGTRPPNILVGGRPPTPPFRRNRRHWSVVSMSTALARWRIQSATTAQRRCCCWWWAGGGRLGASTMAPSRINARGPSDDRRSVFSLRRANPIFSVDECSVCSQLIELYCICCDGASRSGLNESLIACIAMWRDVSSPPSI